MRCSTHTITKVSLLVGATAISTMALAVATHNWIIADETTKPLVAGGEMEANDTYLMEFSVSPLTNITTHFGLWQACMTLTMWYPSNLFPDLNGTAAFPPSVTCQSLVEYESTTSEDKSNQETTFKIAESQRNTAPFFVVNLCLMLLAAIFHVVGVVKQNCRTLIAGIIYIIAGLSTAVGIVLYITYVNDGVHYAGPEKEDLHFEYRYGWSAYVLTISYLSSQVAAVLCITLFLQRYPKVDDLVKLIPGLDKKVPKKNTADAICDQGTLI
ncbi:voltage-dependent calcium channel gamma-7 subunit-like [Saccostrea echinata]|uniref:voltage-dependent calcium channel gamma-7 subunit-like n=1 Tax=Saccostrea echinata TaxID=191078 RepID=UPI002A81A173|nr:voltage-dependent calcium channel gamma-7 subunit-like [Saccostrea echinata]XP_061191137.1 voltage-dependent calcium channel gamma-7 subunit-like [Saccostrea echinata]